MTPVRLGEQIQRTTWAIVLTRSKFFSVRMHNWYYSTIVRKLLLIVTCRHAFQRWYCSTVFPWNFLSRKVHSTMYCILQEYTTQKNLKCTMVLLPGTSVLQYTCTGRPYKYHRYSSTTSSMERWSTGALEQYSTSWQT